MRACRVLTLPVGVALCCSLCTEPTESCCLLAVIVVASQTLGPPSHGEQKTRIAASRGTAYTLCVCAWLLPRRGMVKAVSFAAVLDPALAAAGPSRPRSSARRVPSAKSTVANVASGVRPTSSLDGASARAALPKAKGRRKEERPNTKGRAAGRLQSAVRSGSPHFVRLPSPPSFVFSSAPSDPLTGEVTESIYDFDATWDTGTHDGQTSAPVSTLETHRHPLARALASEAQEQRKRESARKASLWSENERRTSYGHKRRKLDRQSRRSIRNTREQREAMTKQPARQDEIWSEGRMSEPLASQRQADEQNSLAKELASSQQSHISAESGDGVYQTQFSFFKFDDEEERQQSHGTTPAASIHPSYCTSIPSESDPSQFSIAGATQTGYDGDQSASGSSASQSLEVLVEATMAQQTERETTKLQVGIPVYEPILPSDGVGHEHTEDSGSRSNIDLSLLQGSHTAKARLMNAEADQHRLAALCSNGNTVAEGEVRHVRPTIWQGSQTIQSTSVAMSFPLSTVDSSPPSLMPCRILCPLLRCLYTQAQAASTGGCSSLGRVDGLTVGRKSPIITVKAMANSLCVPRHPSNAT